MNEVRNKSEFNKVKNVHKMVVLFYASWCPFSQAFLPIFDEYSKKNSKDCEFARIDDNTELCDEYGVQFYPSVLCFERGNLTKRIDSKPGVGLNKKQLEKFAGSL